MLLQDALEVVQCLHGLANDSDYTIICTIHQPPAEVFVHFTRTILLSGGELVYSGRRRYLPDFFRESGCDIGGVSTEAGALSPAGSISSPGTASKRENIKNLADKMMDWITVKEHADALSAAFKKSDFHASLLSEIKRGKALATPSAAKLAAKDGHQEVEILDASDAEAPTARSLCAQVRIVFRREFTSLWRSFGAFHMPVVATIIIAVIQGLTFWQMPHSADSARDRLNAIATLMDLTSLTEPSWSQGYISNRARLRRDMSTGVLSVYAHTIVWFMLTVVRSLMMTVVQMGITWPMMGIEATIGQLIFYSFFYWTATMLLHSIVLMFTLSAASTDEAMGFAGMFYLFWWQFRGWFVAPSGYNPALRWLIELNPSHLAFQAILYNALSGEEFACLSDETTTLEQQCPLPGKVLADQYDLNNRPVIDALLIFVWMAALYFVMHNIIRSWMKKNAVNDVSQNAAAAAATASEDGNSSNNSNSDASPPASPSGSPALADGSPPTSPTPAPATSTSPSSNTGGGGIVSDASPVKNRTLTRELSVSISQDLVNIVDQFLHPPVALEFKDVQVIAQDKRIVQGASGSVSPGQLLAIMGPSGAGKTSLLNAIIGSTGGGCKVGGSVKLNGSVSTDPLRSREAAFVAQQDLFYEELTVYETLYYAAELQLGHAPATVRATRLDDVLTGLSLNHCKDSRVSKLSGGERRRVSLGCHGLLTPARLLILDEPTTGLSVSKLPPRASPPAPSSSAFCLSTRLLVLNVPVWSNDDHGLLLRCDVMISGGTTAR